MITSPKQDEPRAAKKTYGADEVHSAITNGKLFNYYQPKVDNATRYVVGVEALVRWIHPQDGMVYPNQFIGVVEAHGLIEDLTRVVLINALAQAKAWREDGLVLPVSVNVSAKNLVSPDFVDLVVESSTIAGVPPPLIELEVAESRLKEDLHAPLEALTQLRQNRFKISIDNIDIENSSLAQLSDLPINEIKIEPCYVHGVWNNEKLRSKFESTSDLAKQLGVSITAVGVEGTADWDFVRETGCNASQGSFIANPMPGPNLPGWIRSWHSTGRTPMRPLREPSIARK